MLGAGLANTMQPDAAVLLGVPNRQSRFRLDEGVLQWFQFPYS
jgi:hypothetical protein